MEPSAAPKAEVRTIPLDRRQLKWESLDVEALISEDHPARLIWRVSEQLDLSRFEEQLKSRAGNAGRPGWSAQVLVCVWVYGYTIGVASARALERMMSYEPGLRWLAATEIINHHSLADFRVGHKEALEDLFAQFLALLESAGMVDLSTILHDGAKVKAVAGRASLHRRKTLEKRLRQARKAVRELDRQATEQEAMDERRRAAQERAAKEALARAQAALRKLKEMEIRTALSQQGALRVSDSEPEAHKMKHPDGGWAPSYNVQVSTEAESRMIVGVGVTESANDTQELMPSMERVAGNCGELPKTVIADNGYATRSNVEQSDAAGMALVAPWKDDPAREAGACKRNGIAAEFAPSVFCQQSLERLICPARKDLILIGEVTHHGVRKAVFQAHAGTCRRCRWRRRCCGESGKPRRIERVVESPAMERYLTRMQRPEVQQLYRKRSEIAEFPHLWTKGIKNWRRFSVRGLVKAGMEAIWVALAYNISQWMRLRCAAEAS